MQLHTTLLCILMQQEGYHAVMVRRGGGPNRLLSEADDAKGKLEAFAAAIRANGERFAALLADVQLCSHHCMPLCRVVCSCVTLNAAWWFPFVVSSQPPFVHRCCRCRRRGTACALVLLVRLDHNRRHQANIHASAS
jgi:hypothetical protein